MKKEKQNWAILDKILEDCSDDVIEAIKSFIRQLLEEVKIDEAIHWQKETKKALEEQRQEIIEIVQKEIAKADKYEVAPLERIRIKLFNLKQ